MSEEPPTISDEDIREAQRVPHPVVGHPKAPGFADEPPSVSRWAIVIGGVIGWFAGLGLCALIGLV